MFNNLFDNIGNKLKILAKILFCAGCIISCTLPILLLSIDPETLWLIALILLFIGLVIFLVPSWFIYGFGELIEKTAAIENHMHQNPMPADESERFSREAKLKALLEKGLISEEDYRKAMLHL